MAYATDLNTLLTEYALKVKNAYIDKKAFFNHVLLSVRVKAAKSKAWKAWTVRPRERFVSELQSLINDEVIELKQHGDSECIFVPSFYAEHIRAIWARVDENLNAAFPDESVLEDTFPDDLLKNIDYEREFPQFLKEKDRDDIPVIRIIFPDRCNSVITLSSIIATRLLDEAIKKISFFLAEPENRQFFINRLQSSHSNFMALIDELMNTLVGDINAFKRSVQSGESNTFYLISALCNNIREFIDSDNETSDKCAGVLQSVYLLETYGVYYREINTGDGGTEKCKSIIDTNLNDAPYFFTVKAIMEFSDESGKNVSEYLSREKIVEIIKKKTAVTVTSTYLPELLFFQDNDKEQSFILKNKLYIGFEFQINILRPQLYNVIRKRWTELIQGYRNESAMKNDADFEMLFLDICGTESPLVKAVYSDSKFKVVRHELAADENVVSATSAYFMNEALIPLHKILFFDRRAIISSIKATLPFWYSIPILVFIIKFFKKIK
jgi:hypothetical protein